MFRKLPCDKLERFSPQLVANSLAFMNCVTGSEEQKELEALERLAAKAALLDEAKPIPTGKCCVGLFQLIAYLARTLVDNDKMLSF